MNWSNKIVIAGVIVLIPGTALAIGAVHPWSYSIAEAAIFALLIVALCNLWRSKTAVTDLSQSVAFIIIPLTFFIGYSLFQLIPLPPSVLRVISPSTYEIYLRAWPGWPIHRTANSESPSRSIALEWLPLAISPPLTKTIILRLFAYSGFFLLVLVRPFTINGCDNYSETRFYRTIFIAAVGSATLITSIALVEAAMWNGKVLWIFTPYDWGHSRPDRLPRLIGPFVNPDRFANYLILTFPLALAGTLFRSFLANQERAGSCRIFCGASALIIAAGIFGSLSRAGWVCLISSTLVLVGICLKRDRALVPFGNSLAPRLLLTLLSSFLVLLLVASILLTGSSRMSQVGVRLAETASDFHSVNPGARFAIWKDSLGMVRDFPLFGVGLGSWPDLYPHYRRPPWLNQFTPAAHNDYLQLLAETGAIGFLLLGWFFVRAGVSLYQGLRTLPSSILPIYAALLAGLSAMAFHEMVDFNLQTPSTALLFVLILALALRMIGVGNVPSVNGKRSSSIGRATIGSLSMLSVLLLFLSLEQNKVPYPYNVSRPRSVEGARALLRSHPADSRVHLWLAELMHQIGNDESHILFQQEVRNAIWLEPTNPFARDHYAADLLQSHHPALALVEISRSVFAAPRLEYHAYLTPQRLTSLPLAVQQAAEKALMAAVQSHFEGSLDTLAQFYDGLGQFTKEGELLEEADCDSITVGLSNAQCLVLAGSAYSKAKDLTSTARALNRAIQMEPDNTEAYKQMILSVFAPMHNLHSATELINTAKENGVDPYALYLALSEVANVAGDPIAAEAALSKAVALRPDSQTFELLGLHCLDDGNFNRASFYLRRASEMRPMSAQIAFYLGIAEQSNYQYSSAEMAYERAVALDPKNPTYRKAFDSFKRKMAANATNGDQ